jgi:hypothetical protein
VAPLRWAISGLSGHHLRQRRFLRVVVMSASCRQRQIASTRSVAASRSADWPLAGPGASATVSPSFAFLWSGRHLQSRLHRHRCKLNTAKPPAGRRPMPGLVSVWNMISPACRVRLPRLRPDSGGVGEEEASQDRGSRSTSQGGREVLRPRHHLDAATAADDTIFRFQNKVTNGRPRTTSE